MFGNVGWSELFIIASLAILVVGPKELPQFLRVCGRYFGKVRGFADDFRSQFDDVVRDTQIAEIKDNILKEVEDAKASLPSEKDIGLDFTELDDIDDKKTKDNTTKDEFLDEDENLDWDEPDEVTETNAEGEVIHHSKKEPSEEDDDSDTETAISDTELDATPVSDSESTEEAKPTIDKEETRPIKSKSKHERLDDTFRDSFVDDDDDGALLDEEEYAGNAKTSKDILEEGRQKFHDSVKAEQEEIALAKERERSKKIKKREAEMADNT